MRFTDSHFDSLDVELGKVATLAAELRVPITYPSAKHPEDYAKRPSLQFEENRNIRCQDNVGQFSKLRYNLLQRLAASPTGVVHVLDLCEFNEALQLAPLWKEKIPDEGSLRNFASRINGDLAKYGMPWAVSYSHVHHRFILRFLPDPQAERKKYNLHLSTIPFFQNSVSSRNSAHPITSSSVKPVVMNTSQCNHVALE